MAHPCCGNSLQKGTRNIAIFQIVWNCLWLAMMMIIGLLLMFFVGAAAATAAKESTEKQGGNGNDKDAREMIAAVVGVGIIGVFVLLLSSLGFILSLIFAIILKKGSNERHHGKCKAWLIFQTILWCITLLIMLGSLSSLFVILHVVELVLNGYFIWVVYAFMEELKDERNNQVGWNPGGVKCV